MLTFSVCIEVLCVYKYLAAALGTVQTPDHSEISMVILSVSGLYI